MSQVVSFDDFMHGRFTNGPGETLIVVNAEGRVLATVDTERFEYRGKPYPFRDVIRELGMEEDLAADPAEPGHQER